jgi:hypothetical protein
LRESGNPEWQRAAARAERKELAGAPVIHIDEVAALFACHEKSVWHPRDFPNWAPPFERFFVEWNQPATWLVAGRLVTNVAPSQVGFFVRAVRGSANIDAWLSHAYAPPIVSYDAGAAEWMLIASAWQSTPERPICGAPCRPDFHAGILVRADGGYLDGFMGGSAALEESRDNGSGDHVTPLNILGFGISFMHCHGVSTAQIEAPLGKTGRRRHPGTPSLKHYELRIGPAVRAIRREAGAEHSSLKRALHICRGHFMHYTEERPLFGKYAGTFYCPDHVRGHVDAGRVEKEYVVRPGSGICG